MARGEGKKPSLKVYERVKKDLCREDYLPCERWERRSVVLITRLRAGTNALAQSQGRQRRVLWDERVCQVCQSGQVEDEYHFLIDCAPLTEQRREMWEKVRDVGTFFGAKFGRNIEVLTDLGKRDFLLGKRTFSVPKKK